MRSLLLLLLLLLFLLSTDFIAEARGDILSVGSNSLIHASTTSAAASKKIKNCENKADPGSSYSPEAKSKDVKDENLMVKPSLAAAAAQRRPSPGDLNSGDIEEMDYTYARRKPPIHN